MAETRTTPPPAESREQGPKSAELWERARKLFPGGVNSPVRAFRAVGGDPLFFARGQGPYLFDADGRRYIDLVGSWGPLILGHAHPVITQAATGAVEGGASFGAPTPYEVELGQLVVAAIPSIEMVRFVSSGTEAVMSALRLARAYTGREFVVKFEGCYHGHADSMLVAAGSGAATLGVPNSPGVIAAQAERTLVLPYNDVAAFERLMRERGAEVAAVIVEPIAGNMGVVRPRAGFLDALRARTKEAGALLVFDEVMTGFRVDPGGAQAMYRITPDLTTLSKALGGGFPIGAYGGRADVMEQVAPQGPVYQAGTLSGNPVAMAAGIAQLKELARGDVYGKLEEAGARLARGFEEAFAAARVPVRIARVGSMGTVFFSEREVNSWDDAKHCDTERFARWFRAMLGRGVYLPPSQYEAWFVSAAHDDKVIDRIVEAAHEAAAEVVSG